MAFIKLFNTNFRAFNLLIGQYTSIDIPSMHELEIRYHEFPELLDSKLHSYSGPTFALPKCDTSTNERWMNLRYSVRHFLRDNRIKLKR